MALSWNEIKRRALAFSKNYENVSKENSETQSFYNDFFDIFGISRRRIATFEEPVKKLGEKRGRIDLFWKGTLLVEQKSLGKNLTKAKQQALDYFPYLKEDELPKYILICDFKNFELYDLEENTEVKFQLSELTKNVSHFGFIAGYTKRKFEDQLPVNIEAGELIGELHDRLVENGYSGVELEQFLIRLLFCLFADDTGIFEKDIFKFYISEKTSEDAADLGSKLEQLFQILNQPEEKRQKNLDEDIARFPYINGSLYNGYLPITSFDSGMRRQLIKCCNFNWGKISPAIFGAMFQSATDQEKRRNLGAHYTSEQNIMKVIKPLFLDDLTTEFEKIKNNKKQLAEFHKKIASLKFLDPACGCGNFLIIAYRALRELEIKVIKILLGDKNFIDDATKVTNFVKVNIGQFYGIEIEELPSKIAEVAMWLIEHQMNEKLSVEVGELVINIPLKTNPKITHTNALRINWQDLIKPNELSYILGNPPFVGAKYMNSMQREDARIVFNKIKNAGVLDYVACWYVMAAKYIKNTRIKVGFVSTNSISQGEQVGILWNEMFSKYGIKIHFAHRTFAWSNEAKGKAAVFCVIIGFANFNTDNKFICEYENPKDLQPKEIKVKNINPYLVDASDILMLKQSISICNAPKMGVGNKPIDDGNYLFDEKEKEIFLKKEPKATNFFYEWIGARELINKTKRYVILIQKISPKELNSMPLVLDRINKVKNFRESRNSKPTRDIAKYPTKFHVENFPNKDYIAIPVTSSEKRLYIPISFLPKEKIPSIDIRVIRDGKIYHFGILTSLMHNSWMRYVAGRLKSDYRYSKDIVYNNFPWPQNPSEKQITKVEEKAQAVLDVRNKYSESSLADLYNTLTMPSDLVKAHNELDRAVDLAYGKTNFKNERERIEFLFNLYQQYTQPIIGKQKKKKKVNLN